MTTPGNSNGTPLVDRQAFVAEVANRLGVKIVIHQSPDAETMAYIEAQAARYGIPQAAIHYYTPALAEPADLLAAAKAVVRSEAMAEAEEREAANAADAEDQIAVFQGDSGLTGAAAYYDREFIEALAARYGIPAERIDYRPGLANDRFARLDAEAAAIKIAAEAKTDALFADSGEAQAEPAAATVGPPDFYTLDDMSREMGLPVVVIEQMLYEREFPMQSSQGITGLRGETFARYIAHRRRVMAARPDGPRPDVAVIVLECIACRYRQSFAFRDSTINLTAAFGGRACTSCQLPFTHGGLLLPGVFSEMRFQAADGFMWDRPARLSLTILETDGSPWRRDWWPAEDDVEDPDYPEGDREAPFD